MNGSENTTTDRKEAPYLRITEVRWVPMPGNEYRFKKLFDLLLHPVALKEGHGVGRAGESEGIRGKDDLCE